MPKARGKDFAQKLLGHSSETMTLKYLNTRGKADVMLQKTEYQNSSKFRRFSDFSSEKNTLYKSITQKKTEYDSYIRSREMALGREPCAKSWHLMQGLFSRAL
ncbi:hypothetical protein P5G70_00830 [Serratia nevei]|nr:hypothetical protein [Serratia nevei]